METGSSADLLASDREEFTRTLDRDHDGLLNKQEVQDWILPDDDGEDVATEVRHLLAESDSNKVCDFKTTTFLR